MTEDVGTRVYALGGEGQRSPMGPLRAVVIDDPASLERSWRSLEAEGCATPFQRYDWAAPWFATARRAGRAEPAIVAVSPVEGGDPVAIFPFARFTSRLGRVVGFADLEVADYAGPVLAGPERLSDEEARRACDLALAAITGADVIKFDKLTAVVGRRRNPFYSWSETRAYPESAYHVPVGLPFDQVVESRFEKSLVKNLTRARRILREQKGEWSVVRASTPDEAGVFFSDLAAQRRERFEASGLSDILDDPVWRDFYMSVLGADPKGSFATIFGLKVGDEIVATEFGLIDDVAFHALLPSYRRDGDWKRYSLGQILTVAIMEWCAQNGLSAYDMTIGAEAYKFPYGVEENALRALMLPVSMRGRGIVALWEAKERLREHPKAFAAAKRVLGPLTGRL